MSTPHCSALYCESGLLGEESAAFRFSEQNVKQVGTNLPYLVFDSSMKNNATRLCHIFIGNTVIKQHGSWLLSALGVAPVGQLLVIFRTLSWSHSQPSLPSPP